MIIVFKQNATVEEKTKLKNQLESKGFQIHASDGVNASLFGVVGDTSALDINLLRVVEGVERHLYIKLLHVAILILAQIVRNVRVVVGESSTHRYAYGARHCLYIIALDTVCHSHRHRAISKHGCKRERIVCHIICAAERCTGYLLLGTINSYGRRKLLVGKLNNVVGSHREGGSLDGERRYGSHALHLGQRYIA